MPGLVMDEIHEEGTVNENGNGNSKENLLKNMSPIKAGDEQEQEQPQFDGEINTSIEQLYDNVCDMQSSDQSQPSRTSFRSDGEESRIDSELRHLVGGEMREIEIMEEEEEREQEQEQNPKSDSGSKKKSGEMESAAKFPDLPLAGEKPPKDKSSKKRSPGSSKKGAKPSDSGMDNLDLGPFLLKQARDLISSGDNPQKALDFALRAAKSFEKCAGGNPGLDMVMCLHVTAAIHCNLGQYNEAIPILEQSLQIPAIEHGQEHALAKFAGYMQLGDTYAMLGQLENSIHCYTTGLEIQKRALGETDPRVGETCRYLAEAHVQALQFDDAERLCLSALEIHRENGSPASLEEAADRRLMGLIYETKGDHETALEHLVLASMAMAANGQESEVAAIDCGIGDTYLSLSRFDEAVFSYQKALTSFKATKGENHPSVASVFVRLADLYNKTGKFKESKSYCENALRIYGSKNVTGIPPEEIASGLTDVSAIYESMNEVDQALKLLQKALKIYNDAPGQQSTIAGIEAQMGVMYYMLGRYTDSYESLKSAIVKLRANGEKKSAFFGIALNQMGLACVQCYSIEEAVGLFEEARGILEKEYGAYHPDTLGVYSNLAGAYDALGRLDDAIEILEHVVGMREEKLGTANPEVDDEKKRLAELLKEGGRVRRRKGRSLENLLDANHKNTTTISNDGIKV